MKFEVDKRTKLCFINFNILIHIFCLNRSKKEILFDYFWFIVKIVYILNYIIMRYNSVVFYIIRIIRTKAKYARDIWYAAALIILNFISTVCRMDFYFSLSLFLSFSLSLSLACCSFWPREMEIILPVRLLPNVGGGEEKKAFVPINVHRLYS